MAEPTDAARELLRDMFTRLVEHADSVTDGLTDDVATYRPTPEANTVGWLLWHSARITDAQVSDIAGAEQLWLRDGWIDRFALDLPRDSHGYGHSAEDVAKVVAPAELLAGYWHAVTDMTLRVVAELSAGELARIVDDDWDPPVTVSARLVSIVDDCAQHLGQAAYLVGIAPEPR